MSGGKSTVVVSYELLQHFAHQKKLNNDLAIAKAVKKINPKGTFSHSNITKIKDGNEVLRTTAALIAEALDVDVEDLIEPPSVDPSVSSPANQSTPASSTTTPADTDEPADQVPCEPNEADPSSDVIDFLCRIERHALERHLAFRPEGWPPEELFEFLRPPRMVREMDWENAIREKKQQSSSAAADDDYVILGSEAMLEKQGPNTTLGFHQILHPGIVAVLRGEPGEGKTAALWRHTVAETIRLREALEILHPLDDFAGPRLCLGIPLGSLPLPEQLLQFSLPQVATDYMLKLAYGRNSPPASVQSFLEEMIRKGLFSLHLDALDELVAAEERREIDSHSDASLRCSRREWLHEELLQLHPEATVLVTARQAVELDRAIPSRRRVFRLTCFDPRDVHLFIDAYFSHQPGSTVTSTTLQQRMQMTPGPKHLARIPLLLAILCNAFREGLPEADFPTTRTQLMRIGLHGLMQSGDRRFRRIERHRHTRNELKERLLRHLAWQFMGDTPRTFTEREFRIALHDLLKEFRSENRFAELPKSTELLLAEFRHDGVLIPKGNGYGFILRSLQEYCLGGWIACESHGLSGGKVAFQSMICGSAKEWNRQDWASVIPNRASGWKNVWPFVVGQLKNPDWLIELYDLNSLVKAEEFDLVGTLAAEAIGRGEFARKIKDWSVQTLHKTTAPHWLRVFAATILKIIGDSECRDALIHVIQGDPSKRLVQSAGYFLGSIGDESSKQTLIKLLRQRERTDYERCGAINGLGEIGDDQCRLILEETALDRNNSHRTRAWSMWCLGDLARPESLPTIRQCLNSETSPIEVTLESIWALRTFSNQTTVDVLKGCLRNKELPITARIVAAWSLGELQHPAAESMLIETLVEKTSAAVPEAVRAACAAGLSKSTTNDARKSLQRVLGLSDSLSVQIASATALASYGNPTAVTRLKELTDYYCNGVLPPQLDISDFFDEKLDYPASKPSSKSNDETGDFHIDSIETLQLGSCHAVAIPGIELDMLTTTRKFIERVHANLDTHQVNRFLATKADGAFDQPQLSFDMLPGTGEFTGIEWLIRRNVYFCVLVQGRGNDQIPRYVYFGMFWNVLESLLVHVHQGEAFNPRDFDAIVLACSTGNPRPEYQEFMRYKYSFQQLNGFQFEFSWDGVISKLHK